MDIIGEKEQLKEFGLWLSKRRESCGYASQRQLALKSGVSPATISRIEAGIQCVL
ncbi:MAG: helix-turn-helix domain-containing protein, partial [Carboxydocellales bacterium]